MIDDDDDHDGEYLPYCRACYKVRVEYPRRNIERPTCRKCGEREARSMRHTIVPMNKSNYMHVRDISLLTQLNPKRTT